MNVFLCIFLFEIDSGMFFFLYFCLNVILHLSILKISHTVVSCNPCFQHIHSFV
ncbi:unnamed protein product [Brassica oleracea var. botrytis]|uniref:(rape) hypothetical protein n=1 Tax=Brassica napus TaxID=3708 RepID=A0A816JK79_BRANA|nr:unnamed protein product [Brassica napus]CAF1788562.1 unnamed protein product [Brassica napus]